MNYIARNDVPGFIYDAYLRRRALGGQYDGGRLLPDPLAVQYRHARPHADEVAWNLERRVLKAERPLAMRDVKIIDAIGISLSDTLEKQAVCPSPRGKTGLHVPWS